MSVIGASFTDMAPKKVYTKDQLHAALDAIAKGMSVNKASKTFSIPRTTLMYKHTGKLPVDCRMGPSTILTTNEESLLEQWIMSLAKVHHPVNKEQLLDSVQHIIEENKRPNPFVNSRPGRKWYEAFLKRHPMLSERVAQNLTPAREKVSEQQLRQWFQEIEIYLKSKNLFAITNDPNRVFNSDESAFFLQPKADRVLARKGDKSVYNAGTNDEKENLTVLVTANANGELAPPMIIFKYERIPGHIAHSINKSWGIGRSESGWMCGATFYEYISNIFVPWLNEKKTERPILLFIDGHVSHMTLHLSEFCSKNGIELFALYPNSTHLIQPLDVAVFKPLKQFWKQSVRDWHIENHGNKLRKENFGSTFEKALSKITPATIQNGFKACGLSPFNVENVKFSKISARPSDTIQTTKVKEGLAVLEKFIPAEKLIIFRENCDSDWTGSVEDISLFNVWKAMKMKNISETKIVNEERIVTEHQDESTKNNLLGENHIVESVEQIEPGPSGLQSTKVYANEMTPQKIIIHSVHIFSPAATSTPAQSTRSLSNSLKKITPLSLPSLKEQVPTPFKKALFWPEEIKSDKKRKNKEKIPFTITSESWQEYHRKKLTEKERKEEEKQKRAEERKRKKEEKEKQIETKTKRKRKVSVSASSSENEEWVESGDSLEDISLNLEDEDELPYLKYDDIQAGDFVLAKFLGGKRKAFFYRYICVVQKKYSDHDIEVVSLKSLNGKSSFKLIDTDVSTIKLEDIIQKLPQPELQNAGDRIKYVFSKDIDILEA